MKTTVQQVAQSIKAFIAVGILFVSSSAVYAQNFALINQKPAATDQSDEDKPVTTTPLTDNSPEAKAYVKAQAVINNEAEDSQYTLGTDDILTITVQRHPEVSGKYSINKEGKIQFEFVGDIVLAGMTKDQAALVIAKRLEKYIIHPDVTVVISEYNSKVVYVVGEVGAPGKIYMRGNTITVRDALLAANLPQLTAATDQATLFTPSNSGKVVLKKVNVYALLYKGDLRENYTMYPGDTLYLPATLWAKVARFINPVTQPISNAAGTAVSVHAL